MSYSLIDSASEDGNSSLLKKPAVDKSTRSCGVGGLPVVTGTNDHDSSAENAVATTTKTIVKCTKRNRLQEQQSFEIMLSQIRRVLVRSS